MANATTKFGGLSTAAAKAPSPVEMTIFWGGEGHTSGLKTRLCVVWMTGLKPGPTAEAQATARAKAKATANAKAKYGGLSTAAAKAPPSVEMTILGRGGEGRGGGARCKGARPGRVDDF